MNKTIKLFLSVALYSFSLVYGADYMPYSAFTGKTVVPNDEDYYKYKEENVEIIYTKDNIPFARHTASIGSPLHRDYEKFFKWELDETLYVGLISGCNQIANGFSTQWTNNRQINYMGGAQKIDYFSSTSWLNTLLYHETAHNYQHNIKGNVISRVLHSVFGNGEFLFPLPYIVVPNIMENSFMLEGNAVLHESWHGNGGRLYSGRFKIQTILQAMAGNITPSEVYNTKLAFPYGEIVYIQGGFYNLYMAEKYGIENLNKYFKYFSKNIWWPQYTNDSMRLAVGVDFETSLREFAKEYAKMGENITLAIGEKIASSQFFYPLGEDNNSIFFIINESGVAKPELVVYDKNSSDVTKTAESYLGGKVLKVDGEYFTQVSHNISPTKIYQGVFDKEAFIKKGSESKIVQAYLSSGEAVYFDALRSFSQAQLYVGEKFYAQVNSSVIVDKGDNLYYFSQKGKTRTLYKNKTPLFSYEGFYGMPSDVDSKGNIYFVANSENGSTLYRFDGEKVSRAYSADNIIEARLINDEEVLLACISEKDYYYVKNKLENIAGIPYETKLFFEDKEYYGEYKEARNAQYNYAHVDLSDPYYSLFDMHHSGSELFLGMSSVNGVTGSLNIKFGDPLSQNALSIFANKDELNTTIGGLSYTNSVYLLEYSLSGYRVLASDEENSRKYATVISANLPLYTAGYYAVNVGVSYYQDYNEYVRDPLSIKLSLSKAELYGFSMYYNNMDYLSIYASSIDENMIYGANYTFKRDIAKEFYLGLDLKYSKFDGDIKDWYNGVKLTNLSFTSDNDPTTIYIPSLDNSYYFITAGFAEINVAKVFNISSYWFTFPISLQRESVYAKYRYYDLKYFDNKKYNFNEMTLGLTLATVMLNNLEIPLSIEYIYNDADFIKEENNFKFTLGASF